MELTIEYGFLIASCCYLWITVSLYFSIYMNNSEGLNSAYWIYSTPSIILAFLLQAVYWLLKALPLELSLGSTLAFQQGVTYLITIFVLSMTLNILNY